MKEIKFKDIQKYNKQTPKNTFLDIVVFYSHIPFEI